MGRVSKYPEELRERAVRMVAEVRRQYPSQWAAITAVAGMLGNPDPGDVADLDPPLGGRHRLASGGDSQMAEENNALRKQVAELRRANEILKAAAISFGAELDRPGRR